MRTRSGVIVDDHCMIDYSCDTLMHMYQNHLDLAKLIRCFYLTHTRTIFMWMIFSAVHSVILALTTRWRT